MPETRSTLKATLDRIAAALERMSPPERGSPDLAKADAFVWDAEGGCLTPVPVVNRVDLSLLQGIDQQSRLLLENTRRFATGLPANNALLWGARGMGKSSLVKAAHATVINETGANLKLVEIHREDITTLPHLMALLAKSKARCILFCDDLTFDSADQSYKSLKGALEGGVEGRPETLIFYATSNRRHLMPRDMIENERSSAIITEEAVDEKVSLSDRFGLWLGFHACTQDVYLAMVDGYAQAFDLPIDRETLHARAREWQITRGSRSGRVAWQFIQDLAGELERPINPYDRPSHSS